MSFITQLKLSSSKRKGAIVLVLGLILLISSLYLTIYPLTFATVDAENTDEYSLGLDHSARTIEQTRLHEKGKIITSESYFWEHHPTLRINTSVEGTGHAPIESSNVTVQFRATAPDGTLIWKDTVDQSEFITKNRYNNYTVDMSALHSELQEIYEPLPEDTTVYTLIHVEATTSPKDNTIDLTGTIEIEDRSELYAVQTHTSFVTTAGLETRKERYTPVLFNIPQYTIGPYNVGATTLSYTTSRHPVEAMTFTMFLLSLLGVIGGGLTIRWAKEISRNYQRHLWQYHHQKYSDYISRGELNADPEEESTVKTDTLEELVNIAKNTNGHVIYQEADDLYYFFNNKTAFLFTAPVAQEELLYTMEGKLEISPPYTDVLPPSERVIDGAESMEIEQESDVEELTDEDVDEAIEEIDEIIEEVVEEVEEEEEQPLIETEDELEEHIEPDEPELIEEDALQDDTEESPVSNKTIETTEDEDFADHLGSDERLDQSNDDMFTSEESAPSSADDEPSTSDEIFPESALDRDKEDDTPISPEVEEDVEETEKEQTSPAIPDQSLLDPDEDEEETEFIFGKENEE